MKREKDALNTTKKGALLGRGDLLEKQDQT